jgi:hypothetical protein
MIDPRPASAYSLTESYGPGVQSMVSYSNSEYDAGATFNQLEDTPYGAAPIRSGRLSALMQ